MRRSVVSSGVLLLSTILIALPAIAQTGVENRASERTAEKSAEKSVSKSVADEARARMRPEERAAESQELQDARRVIHDASLVYRSFTSGSERRIPSSVAAKARCVAVIPNMMSAALVVGGAHGRGVISCKDAAGQWSSPAFVNANAGSVGAQVGGRSSDVVLYVMDEEAKDAIKRGSFSLGADAAAVAGEYGEEWDTPSRGVVSYQSSQGAFIGAAVTGVSISKADDENKAMYGTEAKFSDILDGRAQSLHPEAGKEFVQVLS